MRKEGKIKAALLDGFQNHKREVVFPIWWRRELIIAALNDLLDRYEEFRVHDVQIRTNSRTNTVWVTYYEEV